LGTISKPQARIPKIEKLCTPAQEFPAFNKSRWPPLIRPVGGPKPRTKLFEALNDKAA